VELAEAAGIEYETADGVLEKELALDQPAHVVMLEVEAEDVLDETELTELDETELDKTELDEIELDETELVDEVLQELVVFDQTGTLNVHGQSVMVKVVAELTV